MFKSRILSPLEENCGSYDALGNVSVINQAKSKMAINDRHYWKMLGNSLWNLPWCCLMGKGQWFCIACRNYTL